MGETREVMLEKVLLSVGIGASQKYSRDGMGWMRFRGVLPVPITVMALGVKVVPFVEDRYPALRL